MGASRKPVLALILLAFSLLPSTFVQAADYCTSIQSGELRCDPSNDKIIQRCWYISTNDPYLYWQTYQTCSPTQTCSNGACTASGQPTPSPSQQPSPSPTASSPSQTCEQTLVKGRIRALAWHYDMELAISNNNNRLDRNELDAVRDDYSNRRPVLGSLLTADETFDLGNINANSCPIDGSQPTSSPSSTPSTACSTVGQSCAVLSCCSGLSCQNNICLYDQSGCTSQCSQNGLRQCSAPNSWQECARESSGCLQWRGPYTCPSGQICQNGLCVTVKPTPTPRNTQTPRPSAVCGNGIIESDYPSYEDCDGSNFGGNTCMSFKYVGGSLKCASDCHFDYSSCISSTDTSSFKIAFFKYPPSLSDSSVKSNAEAFINALRSEFPGKKFTAIVFSNDDCQLISDYDFPTIESCLSRKNLAGVVDKAVVMGSSDGSICGIAFGGIGGKYAWVGIENTGGCAVYKTTSIFMHELGHTFGLWHLDRDELRNFGCGWPLGTCKGPNKDDCSSSPNELKDFFMTYCPSFSKYGGDSKRYIDSILSRYAGLHDEAGFEEVYALYGTYNFKTGGIQVAHAEKVLGNPDENIYPEFQGTDKYATFELGGSEVTYGVTFEKPIIEKVDEHGSFTGEIAEVETIPFKMRIPAEGGSLKSISLFTSGGEFISGYNIASGQPVMPSTLKLSLRQGWNMVSAPSSTSLDRLKQACPIGKGGKIWFYGDSGYTDSPTLEPLKGYWIYSESDCTAEVRAEEDAIGWSNLHQDWNMISGSRSWNDIRGGCEKAGSIWTWNPEGQKYEKVASYENLDPIKGYWVKVKKTCTIVS